MIIMGGLLLSYIGLGRYAPVIRRNGKKNKELLYLATPFRQKYKNTDIFSVFCAKFQKFVKSMRSINMCADLITNIFIFHHHLNCEIHTGEPFQVK